MRSDRSAQPSARGSRFVVKGSVEVGSRRPAAIGGCVERSGAPEVRTIEQLAKESPHADVFRFQLALARRVEREGYAATFAQRELDLT